MLLQVSIVVAFFISGSVQVLVQTDTGVLSGTTYTTVEGKQVTAFLGVPYAKPPVGEYRFREPQPVEKWEGVRFAQQYGPSCSQIDYYSIHNEKVQGEEDCLHLDIFTPSLGKGAKLDVIFHIHGGGFMFGSKHDFTPDYLLHRYPDVVFVSINYRLGPFGFLTTEDGVIPGNLGLKDQVHALKWVRDNIEHFGGDRHKVTIVGLSAGGASVHFHYLSPLSRHLFQKGISMSGSALCPWTIAENVHEKTKILAKSLDCPEHDSKKLMKCLQTKSAKSILEHVEQLFLSWHYNPFSPFAAVVEKPSASAFLSKHPYEMLKEGDVKDAPWLASVTTEEGLFPSAYFIFKEHLLKELHEKWNIIAPHLLDYNYTIPTHQLHQINKLIREFYLGEKIIAKENGKELISMLSDRLFVADMERSARLQAAVTSSPVYFYQYGYRGNPSIARILSGFKPSPHAGASHGDDFLFVMHSSYDMSALETQEDRDMVETMTGLWMSFVRTGVPSVGRGLDWTPVSSQIADKGPMSYVTISSSKDVRKTSSEDLGNRKFWDSLPLIEHWNFGIKKMRFVNEL